MKIFTVFDDKANAFLQPFFMRTEQEAMRAFAGAAMQEGHQFKDHAADFTLFEIGDFSEEVGNLMPLDAIKNLGNALQAQHEKGKNGN